MLKKQNFEQSISIPLIEKIKFLNINQKRLIVFESNKQIQKYLVIPSFINFSLSKDMSSIIFISKYTILSLNQKTIFTQFITFFITFKKLLTTSIKKKIKLQGLGFKITLSTDGKGINFKLGYSHLKYLSIVKYVLVRIQKNILTVEGDPLNVGNFLAKVKKLKFPDSYKGKGFRYKYEVEKLKEIKKK